MWIFTACFPIFTGCLPVRLPGFTILEIMYSVGIGVGVVVFFNHFGRMKISDDPTPMEVQMRIYENQVDDTVLEKERRKETKGE